jgi:hypothetical protein
LAIGATRIDIRKTKYSDVRALPFAINIVRVWEPDPPEGESAIEWVLLTTEDVSTRRALERVVDIYRLRWTIEEFFKALKTGCSLEKRQITSYDALCKVLAVLAPIAYRLLLLRAIHRNDPTAPPTAGFSRTELHLLTSAPATKGRTAPANMDDALMLLARLGGHLKQNGPPGWQTLGRGYDRLLMLRLGWELARKRPPQCDQS